MCHVFAHRTYLEHTMCREIRQNFHHSSASAILIDEVIRHETCLIKLNQINLIIIYEHKQLDCLVSTLLSHLSGMFFVFFECWSCLSRVALSSGRQLSLNKAKSISVSSTNKCLSRKHSIASLSSF